MRTASLIMMFFCGWQTLAAQCSISLEEVTHVSCNGEASGELLFTVTAAQPYTLQLSNGLSQVDNPFFENLLADSYTVSLTDANACVQTLEVKVKEPAYLGLDLECEGVRLLAKAYGGVKDYNYHWTDEEGSTLSVDTFVDFEVGQLFALTLEDAKGCQRSDTVHVWADFDLSAELGEVPFDLLLTNKSSEGLYEWDFGDDGTSTAENPMHLYEEVGEYEVSLLVTDEAECSATHSAVLHVQGFELAAEEWAEMHNVFSPNGDGTNDEFAFLENHAIASFKAVIYNRWGKKIYEWTDPAEGWDGLNASGHAVLEGVYYYVMKAVGEDGKEYENSGSLSLYR
jgi:gliding motility-associated-like protein